VVNKLKYIQIPEYLKCCLISIECGSDTRILVSKLMKWADNNKINEIFDDDLFQNINRINNELIKIIQSLNFFTSEEFTKSHEKNLIKELCHELRKYVKTLSKTSEVEIEPDVLTLLLDSLMIKEKIILGCCPGAGGYDGVFVLGYGDDFDSTVKEVLENFNENNDHFKAYYIPMKIDNCGTTLCYESN
jgi:phosphomevalonate kinase